MKKGLLVVDAALPLVKLKTKLRADTEWVVVSSKPGYFAFRPFELPDLTATIDLGSALNLEDWKASIAVKPSEPIVFVPRDPACPAIGRLVFLDLEGNPIKVEQPTGHAKNFGGPRPLDDEGTTIVRHPSIAVTGEVKPAAQLLVMVDLARDPDPATAGDPITFAGLPDDWTELPVTVRVSSPHLVFVTAEGTVKVRRDAPSIPCHLPCTVAAGAPPAEQIDVVVSYFVGDRFAGGARRALGGDRVTGGIHFDATAEAPDLTVKIHRPAGTPAGTLLWDLFPHPRHRGHLDGKLSDTVVLGETAAYVRTLLEACARAKPGEHQRLLDGIGEKLWKAAPRCFQDAYWKLAESGAALTFQFITDEPHVPWELMRPVRDGVPPGPLLCYRHPVARWLLENEGGMPSAYRLGDVVTIAPDYAAKRPGVKPLPAAQEEARTLKNRFKAERLEAVKAKVLELLEDRLAKNITLVHYAGHGKFDTAAADLSLVALEDGDLVVAEVDRSETLLGRNHGTLVLLNACEIGDTGAAMGMIGGWAAAFVGRRFSGFIAPLWSVGDGYAADAVEDLLARVLEKRQPVAAALAEIRAEFGSQSPTYASYVYYGDVMARFQE